MLGYIPSLLCNWTWPCNWVLAKRTWAETMWSFPVWPLRNSHEIHHVYDFLFPHIPTKWGDSGMQWRAEPEDRRRLDSWMIVWNTAFLPPSTSTRLWWEWEIISCCVQCCWYRNKLLWPMQMHTVWISSKLFYFLVMWSWCLKLRLFLLYKRNTIIS